MHASLAKLAIAASLIATPAIAAKVQVSDAWIRALPAKLPAAGYFSLQNTGKATITLTGADSPACGMLMLHKSTEMNGMGSMADVAKVDVAAGGTVKFAPGGYHLMCTDPTPSIKPGGHVPVTLRFSDGSAISTDFAVRDARGK